MLLQSLDSDNNPENGITISSSDKATFTETSLTSTEITNKITSLGKPIVSEFEASAHILKQTKLLASSMNKIVTFPKNNAPHTQTGPFTWIRFSVGEALDPATLIPANIFVSSNNTLQSCSYDSRTFIVSCLAPSTGFVASNEYSISLTSSIKKANGTSITPTTISFSVDHPTLAPRIKTGQTTPYASGDDGSYASTLGIAKNSSSLSWSNINNTPATLTGAKAYCTGLNTNNGSWRLPTAKELMTLVDQSNTTSTTPASAILNGTFWTSSELSSGGKWAIDFADYGNDITILDGINTHYTICVSATQTNNNQYIRDISKQIILDSQSGLIWQDTSDNNHNVSTWNEAIGYCENLTLGGFNDWRLPNHQELYQTINKPTDTTNKPNFLYSITNNYWTSTTYTGNPNEAWAVSANDGSNKHLPQNSGLYTRCVRGGL